MFALAFAVLVALMVLDLLAYCFGQDPAKIARARPSGRIGPWLGLLAEK